jgi:hypothetical protein
LNPFVHLLKNIVINILNKKTPRHINASGVFSGDVFGWIEATIAHGWNDSGIIALDFAVWHLV